MDDSEEATRHRRRSTPPDDRGDQVGRRRVRSPSPSAYRGREGGRDGGRRGGRSRSRSPRGKRRRYSNSPGRGWERRERENSPQHRDRSLDARMRERSPAPCGGAFRELSFLVDFDAFLARFEALPGKAEVEKEELADQARVEYAKCAPPQTLNPKSSTPNPIPNTPNPEH
ncbi:hypothetical protein T484DRAFT_1748074 [Baffinella frigidus]|nr:hypothetical protein T484DRAFT_1748074 [Cryptophyta sp. CCMP2293]